MNRWQQKVRKVGREERAKAWRKKFRSVGLIVQELRAIYLLEMTKCLTGIFGKGLPWDIQNRTS